MQPTLFPADPIDTSSLAELAARSMPRAALVADYCCVVKSSDLFEFGYLVAHWVRPGVPGSEVLEYMPRSLRGRYATLPRLTVETYADQVAVHEAIGARVVSAGRRFRKNRSA